MKALLFPARGEVTLADRPDPTPGPGEVLVRVRASGVCHTDLEILRGNYGENAFPLIPGHEFAGEVVGLGESVTGFATGDRVVVDPNLECGKCRACGRVWAHLCERLGAYGVTRDGGFAELCAVHAGAVHPAGSLDFTTAALAEPMGCVLNALSPLEGRRIDRAVVFGAGPMGLLLALALRARGTETVAAVDLDADRLAMASGFGLEAIHARDTAALDGMRHACDLAVEATGVPAVAAGLAERVANGGAMLFFGVCPQDARIEIAPFEIFRRQLSLFGTHSLNHNIPEALAALEVIGPDAAKLVTHRAPLADIAALMAGGAMAGAMKVQFAG